MKDKIEEISQKVQQKDAIMWKHIRGVSSSLKRLNTEPRDFPKRWERNQVEVIMEKLIQENLTCWKNINHEIE